MQGRGEGREMERGGGAYLTATTELLKNKNLKFANFVKTSKKI